MKKNILVQDGTKTITDRVLTEDADGFLVWEDKEIEVPNMVAVTVDMTAEEETELRSLDEQTE